MSSITQRGKERVMNPRWNCMPTAISIWAISVFLALATNPASATPIIVNATADVNQGQALITAAMTMDRNIPLSTGFGDVNGALLCGIPWPKAIIWVLKTAAPAYMVDAAGGHLAGSFEMGQGAELISATFDIMLTSPDTANATLQINGNIIPNDYTGVWESIETAISAGPGHASATGTTIFQSLSGPATVPYVVTYDFVGNPSGVFPGPMTVHQSVDYDAPSGHFTTTVTVVPEPATLTLAGVGLLAMLRRGSLRAGRDTQRGRVGKSEALSIGTA